MSILLEKGDIVYDITTKVQGVIINVIPLIVRYYGGETRQVSINEIIRATDYRDYAENHDRNLILNSKNEIIATIINKQEYSVGDVVKITSDSQFKDMFGVIIKISKNNLFSVKLDSGAILHNISLSCFCLS